jgi:hypothetical protein
MEDIPSCLLKVQNRYMTGTNLLRRRDKNIPSIFKSPTRRLDANFIYTFYFYNF